ncbi:MAG: DMT family transporter [Ruminiclostridium sp.]|nr:DMT family transporter [Ruminiclostridium sp.]
MTKKLRGNIMLLATALIWGLAFVAQSDGMNYVGPFTYNATRTLLGGFVLIPVIALLKALDKHGKSDEAPQKKAPLRTTIIGGICCGIVFFIAGSLQQIGITMTTVGKAGFITALYIVIVPLIGVILYRKTSLKIWLCAAVAVAGFYLLCINEGFSVSSGDLLVLLCAVFFAVHITVIDRFNAKNTDGTLMSCIQFFTAGIMMLVCMFIFEKPDIDAIMAAWLPILYGGVMSCGVAYTLQILGQRHTEPTVATLIMSLESVFAALFGWLLLHETLSLKELAGCALVFVAVIFAQIDIKAFSHHKTKAKENRK